MEFRQSGPRYLEIVHTGRTALVRFRTRRLIEYEAVEAVGRELSTLVEKVGAVNLLLDAAPLEHVGSALIGRLLRLSAQVQRRGGQVLFCHLHPGLNEQLEVLRLHTFFGIYRDEEEAWRALDERAGIFGPSH